MTLIASKNTIKNDMDDNMSMTNKISGIRLVFRPFICTVFMALAVTASAHAGLAPLEDTDMDAVCGSAGIMLAVQDVQIFHHIDSIRYCAPLDQGYIEFQNFEMGGDGDVAKFNFDFGTPSSLPPYYYLGQYTNDPPPAGLMFFDVAEPEVAPVTLWDGPLTPGLDPNDDAIYRGMTRLSAPYWDQELSYTIGNIRFFDPAYPPLPAAPTPVDLGSFYMGLIDMPRFETYTSPPINGTGFDFQHNFQMTIDKVGYAYNDSCDSIELCTTYIGGSFKGPGGSDTYVDSSGASILDDPTTPTTWKPNNKNTDFGEFQIGDLFGDMTTFTPSNPAGIDVGECDVYGNGTVYGFMNLRLPMEGSIRFESATWYNDRDDIDSDGKTFVNFGPGAIDGMQVHRLDLKLIP
jgi:hypothetical protein